MSKKTACGYATLQSTVEHARDPDSRKKVSVPITVENKIVGAVPEEASRLADSSLGLCSGSAQNKAVDNFFFFPRKTFFFLTTLTCDVFFLFFFSILIKLAKGLLYGDRQYLPGKHRTICTGSRWIVR